MFLKSLRDNLPSLHPEFFFTDREKDQIHAIQEAYHMDPSLCLWHMKRVMKVKIALVRTAKEVLLTEEAERKLLQLFEGHCNSHMYFDPGVDKSELLKRAFREL